MEQITLYFRQGSSDKIYQASIEPKDNGYTVHFAFGRRGTTLQTGTKTHVAVDYGAAKAIYDRLINEKIAKGYTPGANGTPYQHTDKEQQATGIHCQLLNPIEEAEVVRLINDPAFCMQERTPGGASSLLLLDAEVVVGRHSHACASVKLALLHSMLRFRTTLLLVASFCVLCGSLRAAGYTFVSIAFSNEKFTVAGSPGAINETGTVAFYGIFGKHSKKIFSSSEGTLTRIGRSSRSSKTVSINDVGRVAYLGFFPGGAGIFTGRGGPVRTVARAPSANFASLGPPRINNQGQICFRAQLTSGRLGIFLIDQEGTLTTIAREGDGEIESLRKTMPPALNNGGAVAFIASRGFRKSGIYITENNQPRAVVLTEDGFTNFTHVAISDAGTIAFRGGSGAVFIATGGEFKRIGEDIGLHNAPISINNSGAVVFTPWGASRIAIALPPEYQPERVIGEGDALFDSTVSFVELGSSSLNDAGQIVFSFILEDGRRGIAVATPSSSIETQH